MEQSKYDLFTFQLFPEAGQQIGIFDDTASLKEISIRKNQILRDVLNGKINFRSRKDQVILNHRIIYDDNNVIVIRLANKKTLSVERSFKKELVDAEPSCLVIFYNDSNEQRLIIESDKTSFGNSFNVLPILEKPLTRLLKKQHLSFIVNPIYEEHIIWDLFKKYEGRIRKIKFEINRPNLGRLHNAINDDIKEVNKEINATASLEFKAPDKQVLTNLNNSESQISELVTASANGDGPTKIVVKNLKGSITTGNQVKSFQFDSLQIEANPKEILKFVEAIKEFF